MSGRRASRATTVAIVRRLVPSIGTLAGGVLLLIGVACREGRGVSRADGGARARADGGARARVLRVCADPNNLPFSNEREEGFENALAQVVAREMGARVEYTWWAQRRGFIRNTLAAGRCDVVMGMPSSMELALTTRPYYRSSYVFVTRRGERPPPRSLDDPVLRRVRVGVQVIGDDYTNAPPAHAMARRGIVQNVRGYSVYGDYSRPAPPSRIVAAVAAGEVDVAIAWGAMAGYFAARQAVALDVTPVTPAIDLPFVPMVYDISLGVRREDAALRDELDAVLARRRDDVATLLERYHVPRVAPRGAPSAETIAARHAPRPEDDR